MRICLKAIENPIFGLSSLNCCLIEISIVMLSICTCSFETPRKIVICLPTGVFREGLMCFCKAEIDLSRFVCILIVRIWIKIFTVYCWGEFKWYLWSKFAGELSQNQVSWRIMKRGENLLNICFKKQICCSMPCIHHLSIGWHTHTLNLCSTNLIFGLKFLGGSECWLPFNRTNSLDREWSAMVFISVTFFSSNLRVE